MKEKNTFLFFKNVHIPIYQKLVELHPDVEVAFGYKSFEPLMRAGLSANELKLLKSYGIKTLIVPHHFSPDITFVADSVYDWTNGCGKIVNVGHGILSKGLYYSDTLLAKREEKADLVFVPGRYHQKVMEKIITTPVKAVGMAKLDALFDGSLDKLKIESELGLQGNKNKYILYAPTFNEELSSIPFFFR